MKSSHFSEDIQSFLDDLGRHGVRFLVVGGEAVILHGYARLTGNLDLFYEPSSVNIARLYDALVHFWGGDVPGLERAVELAEPGLIVQFGRPPHRIDLLNALGPVAFSDAWRRRVEVPIEGLESLTSLPYIGLDDLLTAKRAAGRAKDLDDIEQLTARDDER